MMFGLVEKKIRRYKNVDYIKLVMCPSAKKINLIVYIRKKEKKNLLVQKNKRNKDEKEKKNEKKRNDENEGG